MTKGKIQSIHAAVMAFFILASGCSVPNLATPECSAARDVVKRFYSFHFANEVQPSAEALKERSGYLTERLSDELKQVGDREKDYFTQTADFPKAFRVGACTGGDDGRAAVQVVLLWRDDSRSEQTEVQVSAVKNGETWSIDSVVKN